MNQCFGVAICGEPMPAAEQVAAEFPIVVDLAVENHPDRFVFIRHGLMTGAEVDNAEAPHADSTAAFHAIAFIVGTAVPYLVAHGTHYGQPRLFLAQIESGYAAHEFRYLALTVAFACAAAPRVRTEPCVTLRGKCLLP